MGNITSTASPNISANINRLSIAEPETITVIIKEPHSDDNFFDRKAGHVGIIIGDEYYDFGPSGDDWTDAVASRGGLWWDMYDLDKNKVLNILKGNNKELTREKLEIFGKVSLIEIDISKKEKEQIELWWINFYDNGNDNYSVLPFISEQCTTSVTKSLKESTKTFPYYREVIVQKPVSLLNLLLSHAQHTAGARIGRKLTVSNIYPEIAKPKNVP